MKLIQLFLAAAVLAVVHPAEAQNSKERPNRRQLKQRTNYSVTVIDIPKNISSQFVRLNHKALLYRPTIRSQTKVPLVVSLHGSGGGRRNIEQKKWQGLIKQFLEPKNQSYKPMVLEPQSNGAWDPDSLEKLLDFVIKLNAEVDVRRTYCVGYSMGGKGTWEWAMNYPNRFAAIVPKGFIPDLSKIEGMVDLPIWAMVGSNDSPPRAEGVPAMQQELIKLGSTSVKITVFEGANHASAAGLARREPGVFEWLFSFERK